jgi:hypothetical protein
MKKHSKFTLKINNESTMRHHTETTTKNEEEFTY